MDQPYRTIYQPLDGFENDSHDAEDLSPESHSRVLIHVPENSQTRWNHIEDLDSFFTRVYYYHQHSGFFCIVLQHFFELLQFVFVLLFSIFLFAGIDYDILFRNKLPSNSTEKVSLYDCVLSYSETISNISFLFWLFILVALVFWLLRLGHSVFNLFYFWEIKKFFNSALHIDDSELINLTWNEVQQCVIHVQVEQRMCIHKDSLTELDIYHRILRFSNYFIAMVNKELIPLKFELPLLGEVVFLTKGLKFNIEMLMFWGPWAPFKNNWHLKDEYKRPEKRHELANDLSRKILYVGIVNFIFFPVIFIWQILYSFFFYAEMIKREPGTLGSRRWSHYGEVYLRHFNELDHELNARLNRGYRAASQYMNIFSSPLLTVFARHVAFICGAVFAVFAALTVYDEDVIQVEHVLTLMTLLAAILACCKVFIPEENLVWCPEVLLRRVLAEIHYLPDNWFGKAHTARVRNEFSQLFQYRPVHILEELLSPVVTPFILCFKLQYKALDFVDFYRNFTVEVVGVGDVCSFAQMNVRKHGCPSWYPDTYLKKSLAVDENEVTEGGKTELSLLHFTMTNPRWQPPQDSNAFINAFRLQAQKDMTTLKTVQEENALFSSINSLSCHGLGMSFAAHPPWAYAGGLFNQETPKQLRGGLAHLEGPRNGSVNGILSSVYQQVEQSSINMQGYSSVNSGPMVDPILAPFSPSMRQPNVLPTPQDLTAYDMGLSTLYLHELHQRRCRHGHEVMNTQMMSHGAETQTSLLNSERPVGSSGIAQEKTPLLSSH